MDSGQYSSIVAKVQNAAVLCELKPKQSKILYGVVTGVKDPGPTKGQGIEILIIDYSMTLVVSDPSIPASIEGISINMFRPTISDFPKLSIGTVVKCKIKASIIANTDSIIWRKITRNNCKNRDLESIKSRL
jgi:hypothetical protein